MKTKLTLFRWFVMLILSLSTLGVTAQPYPNSGDMTVCQGATEPYGVVLTTGSNYVWTLTPLVGGNGTIIPDPDVLKPNLISINWTNVGTARLQLVETTGAGCSVTVTIDVIIDPVATVYAGIDQIACATTPAVTLAGTIGGASTSATWSGGTGTYVPNATTLTALYTPSAAEITAGTVTLTLTTNDPAGPCGAVADQMTIAINPEATVYAGIDQIVCATTPEVTLAGTIGGAATTATWSGGTGTYVPNATTLTALYTPSAAEITAGTVSLTLTTNDPAGLCGTVADAMTIAINPEATVYAGIDQIVCATTPEVTLAGTIGGAATSATWSGGTGTFAPDATALTASYTPSAAEITAGTVSLTLTTNDPAGLCGAVDDQMTITINSNPIVVAGNNGPLCVGAALNLTATPGGGTAPYSYAWTGPNGYTSILQNPTVAVVAIADAGLYTVIVTDASSTACTGINSTTVVVNPLPSTTTIWHN